MNRGQFRKGPSLEDLISPEPNTGCWLWLGRLTPSGYAHHGKATRVHKLLYEQLNGPVPDGMELDHICRLRCCVNPRHLEAVTHTENVRRGRSGVVLAAVNSSKTHCPAGHPYDEANTMYRKAKSPSGIGRVCRECKRLKRKR